MKTETSRPTSKPAGDRECTDESDIQAEASAPVNPILLTKQGPCEPQFLPSRKISTDPVEGAFSRASPVMRPASYVNAFVSVLARLNTVICADRPSVVLLMSPIVGKPVNAVSEDQTLGLQIFSSIYGLLRRALGLKSDAPKFPPWNMIPTPEEAWPFETSSLESPTLLYVKISDREVTSEDAVSNILKLRLPPAVTSVATEVVEIQLVDSAAVNPLLECTVLPKRQ